MGLIQIILGMVFGGAYLIEKRMGGTIEYGYLIASILFILSGLNYIRSKDKGEGEKTDKVLVCNDCGFKRNKKDIKKGDDFFCPKCGEHLE